MEKRLGQMKGKFPNLHSFPNNRQKNIMAQKELAHNYKLINQLVRSSIPFRLG